MAQIDGQPPKVDNQLLFALWQAAQWGMAACLSAILDASDAQVVRTEPQQVMMAEPHNPRPDAHALSLAPASPEQPASAGCTFLGCFSSEVPSSPGSPGVPSRAGRTPVEQLVNAQGAPRRCFRTNLYISDSQASIDGFCAGIDF